MIDITTSKVAVPASLFLALSPGIVLRTAGKTLAFVLPMGEDVTSLSLFFVGVSIS